VIPVAIKRKKLSKNDKNSKSQSFNYFIELNNQRQKVCKNAFLQLHQIKKSRLVSKVQSNREISEDLRGKHENQWNNLPQEVLDDVIDFIRNLPSRESHYSPKTERNRKYLSSDLNISKLFKNFIELFSEYKGLISYDFFHNYFKKQNIGFGFPRSDICTECELFNTKIKTLNLENSFEISDLKEKQQKHQIDSDFFFIKSKKR
jgi:hypothetical protein